jgi:broad specificity phosphatase PhoE
MQNGERRSHTSRFLLSVALIGAVFAVPAAAQTPTMVYLVRHAEKAAQPASDPALTPDGQLRARALADVLAHAGVGAIITTQFARTRLTAAPLAERLGLSPEAVGVATGVAGNPQAQADAMRAHVASVVAAVRKHAGSAVLVVGHSNTIPAIVAALGGPTFADLCDGDYDQLFILELPATGTPRLVRGRFGAPAVDAACAKMQSQ